MPLEETALFSKILKERPFRNYLEPNASDRQRTIRLG